VANKFLPNGSINENNPPVKLTKRVQEKNAQEANMVIACTDD